MPKKEKGGKKFDKNLILKFKRVDILSNLFDGWIFTSFLACKIVRSWVVLHYKLTKLFREKTQRNVEKCMFIIENLFLLKKFNRYRMMH